MSETFCCNIVMYVTKINAHRYVNGWVERLESCGAYVFIGSDLTTGSLSEQSLEQIVQIHRLDVVRSVLVPERA